MEDDYTLAELTRLTDAKRRSVQLWAEAGVIRSIVGTDRRGSGTHRKFTRDEAIIACIVQAFAYRKIAIGFLWQVAQSLRALRKAGPPGWEIINKVIEHRTVGYLLMVSWNSGDRTKFKTFVFEPSMTPARHKDLITIGAEAIADLEQEEGLTLVIRLDTYLRRFK